jgi:hypothetical protein
VAELRFSDIAEENQGNAPNAQLGATRFDHHKLKLLPLLLKLAHRYVPCRQSVVNFVAVPGNSGAAVMVAKINTE